MKFNLKVWRQRNAETEGKMVDYQIDNINGDMSFLEMVDVLNANLDQDCYKHQVAKLKDAIRR